MKYEYDTFLLRQNYRNGWWSSFCICEHCICRLSRSMLWERIDFRGRYHWCGPSRKYGCYAGHVERRCYTVQVFSNKDYSTQSRCQSVSWTTARVWRRPSSRCFRDIGIPISSHILNTTGWVCQPLYWCQTVHKQSQPNKRSLVGYGLNACSARQFRLTVCATWSRMRTATLRSATTREDRKSVV